MVLPRPFYQQILKPVLDVFNYIQDGEDYLLLQLKIGDKSLTSIGANYGQSMNIDVSDMRTSAIGISGGEIKAATVKVKSGAVATIRYESGN